MQAKPRGLAELSDGVLSDPVAAFCLIVGLSNVCFKCLNETAIRDPCIPVKRNLLDPSKMKASFFSLYSEKMCDPLFYEGRWALTVV